ncbi:MAG: hypothetical protein ACI92I_000596 [Acidimicrobiales bacterium]|jgi:hypothetical protein
MSEKLKTSETVEAKKEFTLAKAAALAGALFAATPEAVHAWDTIPEISPVQTEQILKEAGLPESNEFSSAEVTHVIPSTNGQYIVQIRLMHKYGEQTSDEINEIVTVQEQTYKTIQEIVESQEYATFYSEGAGSNYDSQMEDKKDLEKKFLELFYDALQENGDVLDVEKIFEDIQDTYSARYGGVMYPALKENLASVLLNTLEYKNITLSEENQTFVDSFIKKDYSKPSDGLYYNQGALEMAYMRGWVQNIDGCENESLMNSVNLVDGDVKSELIGKVNKQREEYAITCIVKDLQKSGDSIAVVPIGGAHNFSQEIEDLGNGTGYIVLTPFSYPDVYKDVSMD